MPRNLNLELSKHHILNSPVLTLLRVFWLCFLIETLYSLLLLIVLGTTLVDQYAFGSLMFLWIAHSVKFIFEIYVVLRIVGRVMTNRYYLTDSDLISYKGLFTNEEKLYDLKKLQAVELTETWFGRHLNYGNLHLTFGSAGYKEEVLIVGISNPHDYRRLFHPVTPVRAL